MKRRTKHSISVIFVLLTILFTLSLYGISIPWEVTGNAGTTPGTNFVGTTDDVSLELKVNSLRVLCLEPDATSPNVIGGWNENYVLSGAYGGTIGGGGQSESTNIVTDNFGTVAGGRNNQAGNNDDSTGNANYALVGGGYNNKASNNYSAVGGGSFNTASGSYSGVLGGFQNIGSGNYSMIPGGLYNTASGSHSFAAGRRAKAVTGGTFVWADSQDADFISTNNDQFLIRASGGVGIGTPRPSEQLDVYGNIKISEKGNGLIFSDATKQTTAAYGDITSIIAGTGLNGGGASGSVTLNVDVPLSLTGSSADPIITGTNTGTGPGVKGYGLYYGVYGNPTSTSIVNTYGIYGYNDKAGGYYLLNWKYAYGVYGIATADSSYNRGVYGKHSVSGNLGYLGSYSTGVYGYASDTTNDWAGYFSGRGCFTNHLGIGTSNPEEMLTVIDTIKAKSGDGTKWIKMRTTGAAVDIDFNQKLHFTTEDYSHPMVIDNVNNNVGINTTVPDAAFKLDVNGAVRVASINITSDARMKKNITPIDSALEKVSKLRGVEFDWNADAYPDKTFDKGRQIGLIAQEVEKVLPETVLTTSTGEKSVEYTDMVAVLIEAVKELKAENQKLEARIKVLESAK